MDYKNVFIEIIDVKIKYDTYDFNDGEEGWTSLGIINSRIYDVLELTGGVSMQFIDHENIETGTIKQIR